MIILAWLICHILYWKLVSFGLIAYEGFILDTFSFGNSYKHKIASIQYFPSACINPAKEHIVYEAINSFLKEGFDEYHQKTFSHFTNVYSGYGPAFKKIIYKDGYFIYTARKKGEDKIEFLVKNEVTEYTGKYTLIFVFDIKSHKVVAFY